MIILNSFKNYNITIGDTEYTIVNANDKFLVAKSKNDLVILIDMKFSDNYEKLLTLGKYFSLDQLISYRLLNKVNNKILINTQSILTSPYDINIEYEDLDIEYCNNISLLREFYRNLLRYIDNSDIATIDT